MRDASFGLLRRLLDAPGPSGFESAPARVWRDAAAAFATGVKVDVGGNSMATVNHAGDPRVLLAGHIDEIGVMVTHIDDQGFLYLDGIGGWDAQVLVGQRVRILTRGGELVGVVGKRPIHLMKSEQREKASKLEDLWLDIGAASREEALARGVRNGDPAVLDAALLRLGEDRVASRAVDNRIGAWVVLEALRLLGEGAPPRAAVTAVATAQEEIGHQGGGARAAAYAVRPAIALAVDVTFSADDPGVEKKEVGDHRLGSGPVLGRGSAVHPLVFERLAEVAEAEGIPYTIQANPRRTWTDADGIHLSREGVATGLISVPSRYMHSPNEMVSLADLEASARLIAAFCRSLIPGDRFLPE